MHYDRTHVAPLGGRLAGDNRPRFYMTTLNCLTEGLISSLGTLWLAGGEVNGAPTTAASFMRTLLDAIQVRCGLHT